MNSAHDVFKTIEEHVNSVEGEFVALEDALGRLAYSEVRATISLPRFNNSAMDGFGVKISDSAQHVRVTGTILAGDQNCFEIEKGSTVKIMTGACVPPSVEAIVPKEDIRLDGEYVLLPQRIKHAAHIRFIGEDIKEGTVILKKGEQVTAGIIAILASQGITEVSVYRTVRVAVFASGNELKHYTEELGENELYNSNTPYMMSRARELGCMTLFIGKAADSIESLEHHIKASLEYDLIITSGGVSVGEADFTKAAFQNMGVVNYFSHIDIKPGKPTCFGKVQGTYVLNLPGNPFAAAIIFEHFGRSIIYRLQGRVNSKHFSLLAKMDGEVTTKGGRDTLIPGIYNGETFRVLDHYAPGMVNVMNRANAYILLDRSQSHIAQSEEVRVFLFRTCNHSGP